MASKFGVPFVQSSFEPLQRAATKLAEGHLSEGLEALSRQKLQAGFEQGIDVTVRALGVPRDLVVLALPSAEATDVLEEVDRCQRAARGSVGQFVGSLGSLVPGGGAPEQSASLRLRAVADKYALDDHIAGPVAALSEEIARWEQVLARGAAQLASNAAIRAVVWRRRLVWAGVAAVSMLVIVGAMAAGVWHHVVVMGARERISAIVQHGDPCQAQQVSADDWAHALPQQVERIEQMRRSCEQRREREAYVARCETLADHVEAGELTATDEVAAKSGHALLVRVVDRALTSEDLMVEGDEMPCGDTPSHDRLWRAFVGSAADSPQLWGKVESISPFVRRLLTSKGVRLSKKSRDTLVFRASAVTERAIKKGLEPDLVRARRLCALVDALGYPKDPWCKALARIDARK